MSLLTMSLGVRFFFSTKGGTGRGARWALLKDANSIHVSGLSFKETLVGTGELRVLSKTTQFGHDLIS